MKKIKNILLISYIKNKGIRRLCFVLGVCLCSLVLFKVIPNAYYNAIDKLYPNLEAANADVYFSHEWNLPRWYRKEMCLAKYLKKYDISREVFYLVNSSDDLFTGITCDVYPRECSILKAIKDDPVNLKCSIFEDYNNSTAQGVTTLLLFLVILFYLPFLLACILKFIFKVLKWIYLGFEESAQTTKQNTRNDRKRIKKGVKK